MLKRVLSYVVVFMLGLVTGAAAMVEADYRADRVARDGYRFR